MALLEVEGLVKYFGRRRVVNGVSFNVGAGEVVGLLGPNGAGKTTSFRMATGQLTPNAGTVTFDGQDVTGLPMYQRARRGMGYLSQEPSVFRKLSVENNLIAILEALPRSRSLGRKLTRKERWERTNDALARFKLDHIRTNVAGSCSGGEKRRLEIARCLVCEPLLILLDEPFAAVDPKTTEDIRENIRDLANHGIGILITDHNVREVFRTADRVYLIADGQVVTRGTPHELVNDQKAIDAYLGRSFEEDGFTRAMVSRLHPGGPPSPPPPPLPPAPKAATPAKPPVTPPPAKPLTITPAPVVPPPPRPAPPKPAPAPATPPPKAAAPEPVATVTTPPVLFPASAPVSFPATTPAPASGLFSGKVGSMLEQEKVRRLVESLADDAAVKAATLELVKKAARPSRCCWGAGVAERRPPPAGVRGAEVHREGRRPARFDPDGPSDVRLRQVARLLRKRLEPSSDRGAGFQPAVVEHAGWKPAPRRRPVRTTAFPYRGDAVKGILLAGGAGSRLYPLTRSVSKQLLPVYDKPVIYYPLSVLMLAGIRDVLVISTPRDTPAIEQLLGDGARLGMKLSYKVQENPGGIAQAFLVGEEFVAGDPVCLILGDNIFFGHDLVPVLTDSAGITAGARVFAYHVTDPERFGVVEFGKDFKARTLEEKPKQPRSNWAVTGLYFYDAGVTEIAKKLKPSPRGELEITDVNLEYLRRGQLTVTPLGRGVAWLDAGTFDSLLSSSQFVQTLEQRQGLKIACLEEIALSKGFIDVNQFETLAVESGNNDYGAYLKRVLAEYRAGGA